MNQPTQRLVALLPPQAPGQQHSARPVLFAHEPADHRHWPDPRRRRWLRRAKNGRAIAPGGGTSPLGLSSSSRLSFFCTPGPRRREREHHARPPTAQQGRIPCCSACQGFLAAAKPWRAWPAPPARSHRAPSSSAGRPRGAAQRSQEMCRWLPAATQVDRAARPWAIPCAGDWQRRPIATLIAVGQVVECDGGPRPSPHGAWLRLAS